MWSAMDKGLDMEALDEEGEPLEHCGNTMRLFDAFSGRWIRLHEKDLMEPEMEPDPRWMPRYVEGCWSAERREVPQVVGRWPVHPNAPECRFWQGSPNDPWDDGEPSRLISLDLGMRTPFPSGNVFSSQVM